MNTPKLIILYGFAASGKTTLASKYTSGHSLALSIEVDQIIDMLGQWRVNEAEAREIIFEHAKAMILTHLATGHDVVVPYLLTNANHADSFAEIAKQSGAQFFEIFIHLDREEAIARLLQRGVWGEAGSPRLTIEDMPEINELYDQMEKSMSTRTNVTLLRSTPGDIEGTYRELLRSIY